MTLIQLFVIIIIIMSNFILNMADAPDYTAVMEIWSYDELKSYFCELVDGDNILSATRRFLSNVEGLGNYFDGHAFFDFQAYLVLNVVWFERENKALNFVLPEYKNFTENLKLLLDGKLNGMADFGEISKMKADAEKLTKLYY